MIRILLCIGGLLSALSLAAQTPCPQPKTADLYPNSYQCYWEVSLLSDTLHDATVLAHTVNHTPCAFEPSAAVTIVRHGADTLRILDLCHDTDLRTGSTISIAPVAAPHQRVRIPAHFTKAPQGHYLYHCQPAYDALVQRTHWGQLFR